MGQRRLSRPQADDASKRPMQARQKSNNSVLNATTTRKGEVFRAQRRTSEGVNMQASQHIINVPVNKSVYNGYSGKQFSLADQPKRSRAPRPTLKIIPIGGVGEMGIGNTSAASCLMSVLCKMPIEQCVGRGTGFDDDGLARKTAILKQALAQHALEGGDAMQALATFGGFEIAMMAGAMLGAAEQNAVLLIDGFIATSALLVAYHLQPNILHYCIFTHCSGEAGHRQLLAHLNVTPLLDAGLRVGEGTGAALAYPLVQAAVNFLNEMASFESAGVSEKSVLAS